MIGKRPRSEQPAGDRRYGRSGHIRQYGHYARCCGWGTLLMVTLLFAALAFSASTRESHGAPLRSVAAAPRISASPAALNFGNLKAGATSLPKSFMVKNTGTSDLVISSIDISGTNAAEFDETDDCAAIPIAPGGSCTVSVTFAPGTPFGKKGAVVTIASNNSAKPMSSVKLSGTAPPPRISASPAALNFGNLKAGATSAPKSFMVKNSGTSDLVIASIDISDTNVSEFAQTNDCATVAAGGSCTVRVSFAPVPPFGKKSAAVAIASNDPAKSTLNVKLSGTAPPPRISATPASLNFGNVRLGAVALSQTFTVKNTGTSDLIISSIDISGTNAADFAQTNDCTILPIAPGGSCVIRGAFEAVGPSGGKSAAVTIASNDPAKPVLSVKLSATAVTVARDVGAVLQTDDITGTLMAGGKAGEMLIPLVELDAVSGAITKVTGALYMNNDTGASAVVYVGDDGRPARSVMGDFILLFSNWSADGGAVDIAKIYAPTGYIEVIKGATVDANIAASDAYRGAASYRGTGRGTCLPVCGNDNKTLAEVLKLSALLISDGLCVVAIPASLGTMALPCTGAVVATATFVSGDEAWLGIQGMDAGFLAMGAAECLGANALSCVSTFLSVGSQILDVYGKELSDNSALVSTAFSALTDPGQQSGVVVEGGGLPVVPSGGYECTPGGAMHYAACLAGGVRECRSDYTWSPCAPVPRCGDGKCDSGETSFGCPQDCAKTCLNTDPTCCMMSGGVLIQQVKSPMKCGHCPNENTTYAGQIDPIGSGYRICDCDDCPWWQ